MQIGSGANPASYAIGTVYFSREGGGGGSGSEADHLSSVFADMKNAWS
jgi:hypothetical protein